MRGMRVVNRHERLIPAPVHVVGPLIDTLSGPNDALWPRSQWPAMQFPGPLRPGIAGGHGPIHYTIQSYIRGSAISFRFTRPLGFNGTHEFVVQAGPGGSLLSHSLVMLTSGSATLGWFLVFRPLHDALIEDSLALASCRAGFPVAAPAWSWRVRLLRRLFRRRRSRAT